MGYVALVREELRALPRGRFTLLGVAVLLAFVAGLAATVGTMRDAEGAFLRPAFGFAPTILIPITAVQVAHARSSRFLQGVFTTPVTATQYVFAKYTVALLTGVAYLASLLPFLIVQAAHLGFSPPVWKFFLFGVGMVVYSASFGLLLGVFFTSRGSLAPFAVSTAAMVATVAALEMVGSAALLSPGASRDVFLRVLHLVGGVSLADALGIGLVQSPSRALALVGFLTFCVGALLLAWGLFARWQSAEGWEIGRRHAFVAAVAMILVFVAPAALAGTAYETAPQGPEWISRDGEALEVHIVDRGADPPSRFSPYEPETVRAGRTNDVDLLLFVYPYPEATEPYREVSVRFAGTNLTIEPANVTLAPTSPLPRMDPRGLSPQEVWPYLRVSVALKPSLPTTLRENPHLLLVEVEYSGEGSSKVFTVYQTLLVESEVSHAGLQMALVGLPFPSAALAGFATRWWRLR